MSRKPNFQCKKCGTWVWLKPSLIADNRICCSSKCKNSDPIDVRFWKKVERKESGCWEWQGGCLRPPNMPYGRFKYKGKEDKAHRISWLITFGSIPSGKWVLHKCDNPKCVSIFHLFTGTPKENTHDAIKKGRRKYPGPTIPLRGTESPISKLNDDKVRQIRAMYKPGEFGKWRIAKIFGVSKPAISAVINRETWGHVK